MNDLVDRLAVAALDEREGSGDEPPSEEDLDRPTPRAVRIGSVGWVVGCVGWVVSADPGV